MPKLATNIYYWNEEKLTPNERLFYNGYSMISGHKIFNALGGTIYLKSGKVYGKNGLAIVDKNGKIYINISVHKQPGEWAYIIAHCLLHLAFGHYDDEKIPKNSFDSYNPELWNKACDIYVTRFLYDIGFGIPLTPDPAEAFSIKLNDEKKIYEYLLASDMSKENKYSTNGDMNDMVGLEKPIIYQNGYENKYTKKFSAALVRSVSNAVHFAGGHKGENTNTVITKAAHWFLNHYPLLGGLAASFKIIEDVDLCHKYEIHIAAVDSSLGEIYVNPSAKLNEDEWKFVLAHEYLHAGLEHQKRCLGRDKYLWNIACDYVINDWLNEMKIGKMPEMELLYDEELHGYSAEEIYDIIVKQLRKFKKHATFRGFNHGDIMDDSIKGFRSSYASKGVSLDEFFKNALKEGFDFHNINNRGYLPAGLVAEIKALSAPPIPWEVELGKWFDIQFPPLEKHRSYARPSRRQGATPDIPRPRYVMQEKDIENRTFGVVVDTSGSMSVNQIGLALGAIASYANSKDVPFVRVVFCDAAAYDAGFMTPDDIAGRVKVTGGGGTILQSAINLLEKAKDFPPNGPILIITDGFIENKLNIHRKHAFLLSKGNKLPFISKGETFYFEKR